MLGQIKKYSTDELDEFPDNSSNFFPAGTELYEIPGLEPKQYISAAKEEGSFIKAVEKVEMTKGTIIWFPMSKEYFL